MRFQENVNRDNQDTGLSDNNDNETDINFEPEKSLYEVRYIANTKKPQIIQN